MNLQMNVATKIAMIRDDELIHQEQIESKYGKSAEYVDDAVRRGDLEMVLYGEKEFYYTAQIETLIDVLG